MTKHSKADILHELEKSLLNEDYIINRENGTNLQSQFILYQSQKVTLNKYRCIRDALECVWRMLTKGEFNETDIVFDLYLENFIKESKRSRSSSDIEPVEFVNLLLELTPSAKFDRFQASSNNKEDLQTLLCNFFKQKANEERRCIDMLRLVQECRIALC